MGWFAFDAIMSPLYFMGGSLNHEGLDPIFTFLGTHSRKCSTRVDLLCHRKNKQSTLLNHIKVIELIFIYFKLLLKIIHRGCFNGMSVTVPRPDVSE